MMTGPRVVGKKDRHTVLLSIKIEARTDKVAKVNEFPLLEEEKRSQVIETERAPVSFVSFDGFPHIEVVIFSPLYP